MKKILFALAAVLAAGASQAQMSPSLPEPKPLSFLVGVGLSAGGDKLATAKFTNGDKTEITAGGLAYLTAGANYRLHPQFSLQATGNFHIHDTHAENGDIEFHRYPIELLAYYHIDEQWRIGGGARYVGSAKLTRSGVVIGRDIEFDSTTSAVLEAEYFYSQRFGIKMRYVKEKFKAPGIAEVNADHVGVSGNFYF